MIAIPRIALPLQNRAQIKKIQNAEQKKYSDKKMAA